MPPKCRLCNNPAVGVLTLVISGDLYKAPLCEDCKNETVEDLLQSGFKDISSEVKEVMTDAVLIAERLAAVCS